MFLKLKEEEESEKIRVSIYIRDSSISGIIERIHSRETIQRSELFTKMPFIECRAEAFFLLEDISKEWSLLLHLLVENGKYKIKTQIWLPEKRISLLNQQPSLQRMYKRCCGKFLQLYIFYLIF